MTLPIEPLANLEWIVDADQRSRFGEAVSLDDGEAEASPEFFAFAVEGGAAGDEGPEFPSELAVNAAEDPPAAQEVFALSGGECLLETLDLRRSLPGRVRSFLSATGACGELRPKRRLVRAGWF